MKEMQVIIISYVSGFQTEVIFIGPPGTLRMSHLARGSLIHVAITGDNCNINFQKKAEASTIFHQTSVPVPSAPSTPEMSFINFLFAHQQDNIVTYMYSYTTQTHLTFTTCNIYS